MVLREYKSAEDDVIFTYSRSGNWWCMGVWTVLGVTGMLIVYLIMFPAAWLPYTLLIMGSIIVLISILFIRLTGSTLLIINKNEDYIKIANGKCCNFKSCWTHKEIGTVDQFLNCKLLDRRKKNTTLYSVVIITKYGKFPMHSGWDNFDLKGKQKFVDQVNSFFDNENPNNKLYLFIFCAICAFFMIPNLILIKPTCLVCE